MGPSPRVIDASRSVARRTQLPAEINPGMRAAVAAGAEDQRLALAIGRAQHAADEDQVIAAVDVGSMRHSSQARHPSISGQPPWPGRMRDAGTCPALGVAKCSRQLALRGRQHVDGETPRSLEGRQRRRAAAQAPQHQGRIERHGGERVGGQPLELALGRARGDHGHPGREATERLPQAGRCVHGIPSKEQVLQRSSRSESLRAGCAPA